MNDAVSAPPQPNEKPLLHRRRSSPTSVAFAPPKLNLNDTSSSSTTTTSSSDDLESNSHCYTSLKDLVPAVAINSPRSNSAALGQGGSDICIRNRLVKQAAWAYLQPMSTSSGSADGGFLRRIRPHLAAVLDLLRRNAVRVLDWTLRITRIRRSKP